MLRKLHAPYRPARARPTACAFKSMASIRAEGMSGGATEASSMAIE
ncbi:MAG: hypothetical protein QM742_05295 [Aquabacterium sp.]